jgi:hypothetical protein
MSSIDIQMVGSRTLPHHKGQDISRPLIRKILGEINATPDQFIETLNA